MLFQTVFMPMLTDKIYALCNFEFSTNHTTQIR